MIKTTLMYHLWSAVTIDKVSEWAGQLSMVRSIWATVITVYYQFTNGTFFFKRTVTGLLSHGGLSTEPISPAEGDGW